MLITVRVCLLCAYAPEEPSTLWIDVDIGDKYYQKKKKKNLNSDLYTKGDYNHPSYKGHCSNSFFCSPTKLYTVKNIRRFYG